MSHWVQLCPLSQAPAEGQVMEAEVDNVSVCLARHKGTLSALNNWCPHRRGPLGQGWIEGDAVICPWHAWAFNLETGIADPPERAIVNVFPIRVENEQVLVELE
jgi:nitrite reductase (NADH) small subunit